MKRRCAFAESLLNEVEIRRKFLDRTSRAIFAHCLRKQSAHSTKHKFNLKHDSLDYNGFFITREFLFNSLQRF